MAIHVFDMTAGTATEDRLERMSSFDVFDGPRNDVSEKTYQCESDSYKMAWSGEELSPGSSQYGVASDAEPRAVTRSHLLNLPRLRKRAPRAHRVTRDSLRSDTPQSSPWEAK